MAYHKSAKKRIRSNESRRDENRVKAKTTRNAVKKFRGTKDKEEAKKDHPAVVAMLDKLAKKGVIHKNKASNLKSKLARKINAL
ncbi:MAG TPA: 30S ribosomal protein S20 [Bacteroidales bacterium]|nr:30S ribosomal protein S20 [Bacteroidales bacterium]HPS17973.1 30S ribosomal protein S20 [Bacteroidales bacterium]